METNMKRIAIGLLALLLLGFVYIGISSIKIAWSFRENTRTAEEALNIANEETVRSVIYHTTMTWSSLDAYRNPEIQSQIATGPYLERFGYKFNHVNLRTQCTSTLQQTAPVICGKMYQSVIYS